MKVVQTSHPTGLLVEKGNIGVTLYTVVEKGKKVGTGDKSTEYVQH